MTDFEINTNEFYKQMFLAGKGIAQAEEEAIKLGKLMERAKSENISNEDLKKQQRKMMLAGGKTSCYIRNMRKLYDDATHDVDGNLV